MSADQLAGEAMREQFGWRGHGPVLLASVAGFGLAALGFAAHPAWRLALGLWVGYGAAYALAALSAWLLMPRHWRLVLPLMALSLLIGAMLGAVLEQALTPAALGKTLSEGRVVLYLGFVGSLLLPPLLQSARRRRALQELEAERARVRAELQLLQAQIEPHFLFNTLATLRSLVRQRSDDALPLLDRMTAFLEAVLPQVRERQSTLGRELHIVEQYLAIMALRMGPRLRYRIEVAPTLQELALPPLLIQPLVENAVLHGVEPCEAGGQIVLGAALDAGRLRLSVTNTGMPLGQPARQEGGQGLALRNLAERLLALYGGQADFTLRAGAAGTEALLTLPGPAA